MSDTKPIGVETVQPKPEFETVKCHCGADDYTVVLENLPSGRLVRCNKCEQHYINPRLLQYLIADTEDKDKYAEVDLDKVEEPERWEKTFNRRLSLMKKYAPQKGKFLDVGCYAGFFLKAVRDDGWEVYGVEPTVGGATYAREKFALDVAIGTLEETEYEANSYDAVALLEVIEHVPDPNTTIAEVSRILKPGGIFLIETPTINNIWFKLLKGKWRHFIECHFWFFSEKTLGDLLKKHGLEPVEYVSIGRYTSIRHLIGVLHQHFRPLSKLMNLVLVRLLKVGGATVYINPGDNMLIIAKKK